MHLENLFHNYVLQCSMVWWFRIAPVFSICIFEILFFPLFDQVRHVSVTYYNSNPGSWYRSQTEYLSQLTHTHTHTKSY